MSRTRMIKPSFFKHAELYAAEQESGLPLRIAFAGLWTVTDRAARFKWKPDLKPDVLPYDQVDMLDVLDALEQYGFVRSYVVAGKKYGLIPTFSDHQTFHHTERASTLPAPVVNGEPPVSSQADTVTVAGTVAELAADDLTAAKEIGATVPPEPDLTALFLAICANKAVTEKWGESTTPYTQASAASLYDVLRSAGVPPEVARLSFYRQCREAKAERPPRSINYFRPGIEEDWKIEQTRRAVAASGEVPPSLEETSRPPARASAAPGSTGVRPEHWKDKNAREDREEAERQLVRMRHGNIEQRRAKEDGDAWWRRMQREATAAGQNATLYGYDRLHEPANLSEVAHA